MGRLGLGIAGSVAPGHCLKRQTVLKSGSVGQAVFFVYWTYDGPGMR